MDGARAEPEKEITLGILLVHGVGSERRGDSLVAGTTALHNWVKAWATNAAMVAKDLTVDLVDTRIVQASAETPAHARLVLRLKNKIVPVNWLLTESCWFDTYRRPGFLEFLKWAVLVLPVAAIVHFIAVHQRVIADIRLCNDFLGNPTDLKPPALARLINAAAPKAAKAARVDVERDIFQERVKRLRNARFRRLFSLLIEFTLTALLAMVTEVVLVGVALLAIVPGYTRDFAGWIQRKLTATIGDSYMFVASPITEAAVATRVKSDLDWLRKNCDEVVILAHSQGAAVSYTVLERETWGGEQPKQIAALATYGSGLRKLHDLKHARHERGEAWMRIAIFSAVVAMGMATLAALAPSGMVSIPTLIGGLVLGFAAQILALIAYGRFEPPIPDLGVKWRNFFSTHDPVPFGPLDVNRGDEWQQEVVNRMSVISDHTSYWSSSDDFVAKVVQLLADSSGLDLNDKLDEEWLNVSAHRRRWRVTWLANCRIAALVTALALLFLPKTAHHHAAHALETMGFNALGALSNSPWWTVLSLDGVRWVGGGVQLAMTLACFLAADAAWRMWDRKEQRRFFRRQPYALPRLLVPTMVVAWFAAIFVAPAIVSMDAKHDWRALAETSVVPIIVACWSLWTIYRLLAQRRHVGTPSEWGQVAVHQARVALADKDLHPVMRNANATSYFRRAKEAFRLCRECKNDWEDALRNEVKTRYDLLISIADPDDDAEDVFQAAVRELDDAGKNTDDIAYMRNRARELNIEKKKAIAKAQASAPPSQREDELPELG